MNTIEITIAKSVQPCDWGRVAEKKAKSSAEELGINWIDADVFVMLPEAGRFLTKQPGFVTLGANG